jgi:two-component system sensor histidine kinase KdpD
MLQEAIVSKSNNIDVAIGLVETHGRKETEALVGNLEVIPRKKVQYGKIAVTEMDLDAIIARHPKLVLVDELAHTNIPGSRHSKRYQDVEELLHEGIDVYSTLNIQHVQSLTDIVQQITTVKVEEIIPDRILQIANEMELVDLPPEKLQQRLAEGKVYIPEKARQAIEKFFKKGNLLALRELALKYTAKRVDIDLLSYREQEEISSVWPVESKLLVSIGAAKVAEKLLLITHRMATDLEVEWYAVHVESPQQVRLSDKDRTQLHRNLRLAEELGAKVVTLSGAVIADEILRFAKQKNVTLIITGLSHRSRFEIFFKGSILNRLVKNSGPINVLVVGGEEAQVKARQPVPQSAFKKNSIYYLYSFLAIVVTAAICWLFTPYLNPTDDLTIMLLPVVAAGILWGSKFSVFSALFAVALIDFFFIPPYYSLAISNLKYLGSFIIFLVISFSLSALSKVIRFQAKSARYRERFISALFSFGHEMMIAENVDDLLTRAVRNISEAFETDVIILLPDESGNLESMTKSGDELFLNESEKAVAVWVYKNGQPAGRGTSTLSSAKWYYVPLRLNEITLGVLCLMKTDMDLYFTLEQKRLLESFVSVVSLSLAKSGK